MCGLRLMLGIVLICGISITFGAGMFLLGCARSPNTHEAAELQLEELVSCSVLQEDLSKLRIELESVRLQRDKLMDAALEDLNMSAILGSNGVDPAQDSGSINRDVERFKRIWSCGAQLPDQSVLLEQHPAITAISHLGAGREYFSKTLIAIQKLGVETLRGSTVLEIGYGVALSSVILRGLGANIYATEIRPVPWVPLRHGPFFAELMAEMRIAAAHGDFGAFDVEQAGEFARRCGRDVQGVALLETSAEELAGVPDEAFDVIYSLAVLEHISNVDAVMKAIARVARPGGLVCHQIDMRDHRNTSAPWEFLLDDSAYEEFLQNEFREHPQDRHPFFGNRVRISEFMGSALNHGLQTVLLDRQHEPESEEGLRYAAVARDKLRACSGCRYQYAKRSDLDGCTSNLMPITGVYWCTKKLGVRPVSEMEEPPCGQDVWYRHDYPEGARMARNQDRRL